jgi:DNA-binding MarR family transcriptional regulator
MGVIMSRALTIGRSTVLATTFRWAGARYTELREWTGLSDATVTRAIKDLLDLGLLEAHASRHEFGRVYVTYKLTTLGEEVARYLYYNLAGLRGFDILKFVLNRLKDEASDIYDKYKVKSSEELWIKLEKGEVTEEECREDLERLEYLESRLESVRKRLSK